MKLRHATQEAYNVRMFNIFNKENRIYICLSCRNPGFPAPIRDITAGVRDH